jgi:hypothetical protein
LAGGGGGGRQNRQNQHALPAQKRGECEHAKMLRMCR